jgi:hypothetical protein
MLSADVCKLPATGGSTFVLVAALFMLVAGVVVARWVRQSARRMSVVVAPLVLLGGLVLVPSVTDPCSTAPTTVAPTTTTLEPVVYSVGDPGPGGGTIFYVNLDRSVGSQYFEVACAGWSDGTCGGSDSTDPQKQWGCLGEYFGADSTTIGTGEQNTIDIVDPVTGCSESDIAAKLADDLVLGGQTDWFLPSRDEMNALCKWAFDDTVNSVCNADGSGSFSLTNGDFSADGYWSSSEVEVSTAWRSYFDFGAQYEISRDDACYVRPVRSF